MERALPKLCAQASQRDRFIQMLLDVTADGLNHLLSRISANRLGPAAQACAEAGFLSLLRHAEKSHVLAARALRGAGRAAIHAGRGHSENKFAVAGAVARQHRLPPRVFYDLWHL